MKKAILIIIISVLIIPSVAFAQAIPSSSRSREAIKRVQPKLQKEFENSSLKFGSPIYVRLFKEEKELEIWVERGNKFHLFKKYPICTYGYGSLGPKTKQGDGQAPEGFYYVKPNHMIFLIKMIIPHQMLKYQIDNMFLKCLKLRRTANQSLYLTAISPK